MDQNSFYPANRRRRILAGRFFPRKRTRVEIEPGYPKNCDLCKVVCHRKFEYESHMKGKRHLKEMRKKELAESIEKEKLSAEKTGKSRLTNEYLAINPTNSKRICTLCGIELSSVFMEVSHFKGKKHLQNVKKTKMGYNQGRNCHKGNLGVCEACRVPYTSLVMKKTHVAGKKHIRNCQRRGFDETGLRKIASSGEPFANKPSANKPSANKQQIVQTALSSAPKPVWGEVDVYIILEKQAEEAYEEYKRVAPTIPLEQSQALYLKYQALYKAYEAAYQEHVQRNNLEIQIEENNN